MSGKKAGRRDWSVFGWHSVCMEVPSEWSPAVVSGDRARGYVALDDEETVCLELRWEPLRRAPDWARMFQRYLKKTAKTLKCRVSDLKALEMDLSVKVPYGAHAVRWSEGAATKALVAIDCEVCSRLILIHVVVPRGWGVLRFLTRLLGSFSDHREDETDLWACYGLRWSLPASLALTQSSFKAGLVELHWRQRKDELAFWRLALGQMTMAGRDLASWATDFLGKRAKRYRLGTDVGEHAGHEAVSLSGQPRHLWSRAMSRRLAVRAWLCERTDRLFFATLESCGGGVGRLDELVSSLECHEGSGDFETETETWPSRKSTGSSGG